jgi:signal transduction histidine kinase
LKQYDKISARRIALVLFFIVVLLGTMAYIQLNLMKDEICEQESLIFQMAGTDDDEKANLQTAASILKGEFHEEQAAKGQALLEEYGYTKDYLTRYDKQWKELRNLTLILYGALFLILITLYYIIIRTLGRRREEELREIKAILSQFSDGKYEISLNCEGTDIRNKLNSRLESFGRHLQLKDDNLQKEKEETKALVTDISHQLKTPVTSLKMCSSLLSDASLEPEERQEFLYRLSDQIDHLEILTKALINISRMETGMITIKKEMYRITDTITKAVNQVYLKAEAKDIRIMMEASSDHELEKLVLLHDPKWTAEAIANVLDNGIKYSASGTKLLIRMSKQVSFLRIEIEDEGIGIAKEEYHQIFKRFYRGKSEVVANAEGSGIGLYLSRKIIEEQGGSITVTSADKGSDQKNGSIFVVQLRL